MDSDLVSDSLSGNEESERNSKLSFLTYTKQFYEHLPYYLSIGMSYDLFFNGSPVLVKCYREAEKIRVERKNQELWLQGFYVYDAICDASPIFNPLAKSGTKPHPYPEKPYAITKEAAIQSEEEKERKIAEKGKCYMEAFMSRHNARFGVR